MPKIIRVGGYKDFTIMENDFLRDMALDIPERGLLATMLSLPEDWDFSGIGLTSILPCGKTKVFNTLKKLELAGYLKRKRIYENGKVADWEYHICGRPIFKDENNDTNTTVTDENQNSDLVSENLYLENLLPENQEVGFQEQENPEDNIIYNNKILNNQIYNNQSIHQSNNNRTEIDRLIDNQKSIEKYEDYKKLIKENIEYDILSQQTYDNEQLDEIVNIMAETVAFNQKSIKINGNNLPADIVKSRFLKIGSTEMEYILETLSKNTSKIYNIRAYLITTIYNAKDTLNSYYKSAVQHDLYG